MPLQYLSPTRLFLSCLSTKSTSWLHLTMWSKLRARGRGQQARIEPSAVVNPASGDGMPLSLPGDDKVDEASSSHPISSTEEHFGLFPIEPANCPTTSGPAILESVSNP